MRGDRRLRGHSVASHTRSEMIESKEQSSVVVRLCKCLVVQVETGGPNHLFCSGEETSSVFVGCEFENHVDPNRSALRIRITFENLAALYERQVPIELLLEKLLMLNGVRPVEMIANRKNDMACSSVHADDVDKDRVPQQTLGVPTRNCI